MTVKNAKILNSSKFIGIALGGSKTDRTSLAVVEYYPDHKKAFLSHLYEKIKSQDDSTADAFVHQLVTRDHLGAQVVALDAPLVLPKCVRCKLVCPGYENCGEPEIKWFRKNYAELNASKRPQRYFSPYLERCAEFYITHKLEEKFYPNMALGSNQGPMTMRASYLARRWKKQKLIEVQPALSLWRIGRSLGIQKSYLRHHKHSVEGLAIRKAVIEKLSDRNVAFLYEHDMRVMINNAQAFDAFLCAFTALLSSKKQTESRPEDFPKHEGWVEIPRQEIDWTLLG